MIPLNIFNDFCSWWVLWWILPFILGVLLGWALYGKWKQLYDEEKSTSTNLSNQVAELQTEIKAIKKDKRSSKTSFQDLEAKLVDYETRERYYKSELKSKNAELAKHKMTSEQKNLGSKKDEADAGNSQRQSKINLVTTPKPDNDYGVINTEDLVKGDSSEKSLENNMQVIEGIGPRMESVLYENGIHNWVQLSNYTGMELKEILNKYGSKYAMINAKHWPMQASLAASGNWEELISYQKSIYPSLSSTKSKAESFLIKSGVLSENESKNTDLKTFVGIDSKIESILKLNGIGSWEDLATTPIVKIRGILEEANKNYKDINPTSWPKQAQLALAGKVDMLREYQDFLKSNS